MSKKPVAPRSELRNTPTESVPVLRAIGGSNSEDWNSTLTRQAIGSLWFGNSNTERTNEQVRAVGAALAGIKPECELEAMLGAQLIACHNAAMQCFRLAAFPDQTFECVREFLNQANKLSRSFAMLLETLDRHRGKGAQKVTVEHVHVYKGGQAIVGNVEHPGGSNAKSKDQPDAKQIANAPEPAMWSAHQGRDAMPITRDAERPLPDARRTFTRSTEGE